MKQDCKLKYLKFLALAMLLVSSGVYADLSEGLVAYYPFNGNANDESGNGFDGIVRGATPVEDRFGNIDSAYYFNGNGNDADGIELPSTSINGLTHITSSVWIQNHDTEEQAILNARNQASDNQYIIHIGNELSPQIKGRVLNTGTVINDQQ